LSFYLRQKYLRGVTAILTEC